MRESAVYLVVILVLASFLLLSVFGLPQQPHFVQQQPGTPTQPLSGAGGSSSGFSNWRSDFGEQPGLASNNKTSGAGVTYYWGSHQVGESVLAFSKDKFSSPLPQNVHRTITYQNPESRISYLEVFVRNAAASDQVYVSSGGVGANFIAVYIGTQTPTTYFEYKATLYGFE